MPAATQLIRFDRQSRPSLLVFVDTEEEFPWHTFSRKATSVHNIAAQPKAQRIMNDFGVKPTYLVDYPVAAQPEGYEILRDMAATGACAIGAQLHPWVNPPLDEQITVHNTFAGNLPAALERAKIEQLTALIEKNFGQAPTTFKAGRYGAGPNTVDALIACGYRVDASVMPLTDFSAEGGPDYSDAPGLPYWLDSEQRMLEIPNTVGLVGLWDRLSPRGVQALLAPPSRALRIPGLLSRLGLLERIRLTPEGISLEEAQRLTLTLMRQGQRLFVLSYHSSSLLPGANPYVKTEADLENFLAWMDGYFRFFFGPLSGRAVTPDELYATAKAPAAPAPVLAAA